MLRGRTVHGIWRIAVLSCVEGAGDSSLRYEVTALLMREVTLQASRTPDSFSRVTAASQDEQAAIVAV